MKKISIISLLPVPLILFLSFSLVDNIREKILWNHFIKEHEIQVQEKLYALGKLEKLYKKKYGEFTLNENQLYQFLHEDSLPIVEQKEKILRNEMGYEVGVAFTYDTLSFVAVREDFHPSFLKWKKEELFNVPNTTHDFTFQTHLETKLTFSREILVITDEQPLNPERKTDHVDERKRLMQFRSAQ